MWLLRTSFVESDDTKLVLERFIGAKVPRYAILSHTWGKDEVLFEHIKADTARERKAFPKVRSAALQARLDRYRYIWVDTCCINSDSSAELQEAINSMYKWYAKAEVCYAYLVDVENLRDFESSRWFTRGWTLQELLAPMEMTFYQKKWHCLGDREDLARSITKCTGIGSDFLCGSPPLRAAPVSMRMSWMAKRDTTREEDIAYCLLGLFDINMTMLYGEGGRKAFIRLQEEIMKNCDDDTLFAWTARQDRGSDGLLADSPRMFRKARHFAPAREPSVHGWAPRHKTSAWVTVELRLVPHNMDRSHIEDHCFKAVLECRTTKHVDNLERVAIYLRQRGPSRYIRIKTDEVATVHKDEVARWPFQKIFVPAQRFER